MDGQDPGLYEAFVDRSCFHSGTQSAHLRSTAEVNDETHWFTLSQHMSPQKFLNKRVRMSVWVKTKNVNCYVQPWMRVDGAQHQNDSLSFDNMCSRYIKGTTDWTQYHIVLDVPGESTNIAFGIVLGGRGDLWFDDVSFEIVKKDIPVTDCPCSHPERETKEPTNLNFEEGVHSDDCCDGSPHAAGWWLDGNAIGDYECAIDKSESHSGTQSAYIQSKCDSSGFISLSQDIGPQKFLQKRVRMSVWLKLKNVEHWAAPWIRVDGPQHCQTISFDNKCRNPLRGSSDWLKYELVVDVPNESLYIAFGVMLGGSGRIWIDDVALEAVSKKVPITDCPCSPKHPAFHEPKNLNFELEDSVLPPWARC